MRRETTLDEDDSAVMQAARLVGASVITIAIIALVVNSILGASAFDTETTVENESVTVDYNNLVSVSEGSDYLDDEVVYAQDGSELTEGTDYEWYTGNGSIEFFNTTATTSGNTAEITYTYTHGGPFMGVISSLTTTGVAAMSLLVVGLLVVAANTILGRFGGGGGF